MWEFNKYFQYKIQTLDTTDFGVYRDVFVPQVQTARVFKFLLLSFASVHWEPGLLEQRMNLKVQLEKVFKNAREKITLS